MNIILLSGGSGRRLWPLSNDIRSKQFIKLFKKKDGTYESMVQRMYRQILNIDSSAKIIIATSKAQVSALNNQLGDDIEISVEPCRKDTFPAIALATAFLHEIRDVSEDEAVVVCPVDPYVNNDYFEAIEELWKLAQKGSSNLNLMGIVPTYPSEKYGYIIPVSKDQVTKVVAFKEKPDARTAQKYIEAGALWNCGVFAYKIKYVLDICKEILGTCNYCELFSTYENLKKISFDYAVVEKEKDISVMRFTGLWKDLGTWNSLLDVIKEKTIGNDVVIEKCKNTCVVSELNTPIICIGAKDLIVAASMDGILVAEKEMADKIKPIVEKINQGIRFSEKSWGEYRVIEMTEKNMIIKITVNAGHRMSYHSHEKRNEVWAIMSGFGYVILDGIKQNIKPGDVVPIQRKCKHTIVAYTKLELIEIQLGKEIIVTDKQKFKLEF